MDWVSFLSFLNPAKWTERAWGYFTRPTLRVYFDANETYHLRKVADLGGARGFFCHLMVRNDGKQTARDCQGRLIEVHMRDSNGQFKPHPDFVSPVVLKWAHETDFTRRDIEPDLPRRLDLCYAVESMPGVLIFFTPKVPSGNRTDFPPGTYRVKVRVYAGNASHADGTVTIVYNGTWNQIELSEQSSP